MSSEMEKIRARIQHDYIDSNTELVDEFLWELNNPEKLEIVEALECNGYSHFRVMDTIIYRNIDILKECKTIDQVVMWYLVEEEFINEDIFIDWINTTQVYTDMIEFGYRILPNPAGGFILIR